MMRLVLTLCARIPRTLPILSLCLCMTRIATAQTPTIPNVPTTSGNIAIIAGNGTNAASNDGGAATSAGLSAVYGVVFDSSGNLYIGDGTASAGLVRVVSPNGNINPYVGNLKGGTSNTAPNGGPATSYTIGSATMVLAIDSNDNLYVADSMHSVVDEVDAKTQNMSIVAGTFNSSGHAGENVPATSATLASISGLAVDAGGNIYITDLTSNTVRIVYEGKTVPAALAAVNTTPTSGNIYTIVGSPTAACTAAVNCGVGGPANNALLSGVYGLSVDTFGNLYIANRTIGTAQVVYQGGTAAACLIQIENPTTFGLQTGTHSCAGASAVPVAGHLYALAGSIGTLCTVATSCPDGNPATTTALHFPTDVIVDGAGNVFVTDLFERAVRRVDSQTGVMTTVAGTLFTFSGTTNIPGPATMAKMTGPSSIAFDAQGNLFITDSSKFEVYAVAGVGAIPLTPQTVTFGSLPNVTYGASAITLNATSTNFNIPITYTVTGPASISGSTLTITGAGSVAVTANQAGDSTHSAATPVTQSFTVNQATLTVAGVNVTLPQGAAVPSPLYTITGLISPDTISGTPAVATQYTNTSPIGPYPITVGQGSFSVSPAANYSVTYTPGQIIVGGGTTQTIMFPALPANLVYGGSPVALTATSSAGLPITYVATGSATVTGTQTTGYSLTILNAGGGSVTASQIGNSQYAAATSVTQVFTVGAAQLTVKAGNISLAYGSTLPSPFPYTVTGLVGSDSVGGNPTITTAYTPTDAVGTNDQVVISRGSLAIQSPALPGNYIFASFVPGNIAVTQAANTITFPAISTSSQAYGAVIPLAARASSGLAISYSVTGNATLSGSTLTITGLGPISITASQSGNANYAAASPVTQSFTARQAVLSVVVGYYTRPQGAVNPTFTAQLTGFVNGDADTPLVLTGSPLITTTATSASPVGTYSVTPALGTLFSQNYTFAFIPGTLVVTAAPSYTITASPNALTIPFGQSGQTVLDVKSQNEYQGSVTFGCGQVPIGITCTFSPAMVNITYNPNNPGTASQDTLSTLTVTTTGATAQLRGDKDTTAIAGVFLLPGGLAGLLLLIRRKQIIGNPRLRQFLLLVLLLSGVSGLGACGSSNTLGQAPMGNTTIQITATGTGTPSSGSQNTTNLLYLTVDVVPLQ